MGKFMKEDEFDGIEKKKEDNSSMKSEEFELDSNDSIIEKGHGYKKGKNKDEIGYEGNNSKLLETDSYFSEDQSENDQDSKVL